MEWISVEERRPRCNDIGCAVSVKLNDDSAQTAFFYRDKMQWIAFYGQNPCYFWSARSPYEPLYHVTHWMPIPKTPEENDRKPI